MPCARVAAPTATGQDTNSQVQQTVLNYLQNAGLPSSSATVTVTNLTHSGTDCTLATELDQLQVKVSLPFSAVRWSTCTLVTSSTTALTASTIWYSNNGQSYPTSITMPQAVLKSSRRMKFTPWDANHCSNGIAPEALGDAAPPSCKRPWC